MKLVIKVIKVILELKVMKVIQLTKFMLTQWVTHLMKVIG